MFNSQERKLERMLSGHADTLSGAAYNAIMVATLLYGFVVNAVMVVLFADSVSGIENPIPLLIGYLVSCLLGSFLAASDKPVMSFLGYNLIVLPMGVLLCAIIPGYGMGLVMSAIVITGAVTLIIGAISCIFPQVFLSMGRALLTCLLVGCVLSVVSWFVLGLQEILVYAFTILYMLYLGYDLQKAQLYPKTVDNAIDSAIDLYLDIINLFLRILRILAKIRRDD